VSETKQLKKLVSQGWISRREFVKRMSALGVSASLPVGMLASMPAYGAPKKGGNFRVGLGHGSTTDSVDPATWENAYTQFTFGYGSNNHLTEILPNGNLGPELAESWEASPDAKVWTFKLRKGVEFHNGKTMEASDVIASLNHHRGEDTKSGAKGIVSAVTDMKADGKNVVVITLDGGNADFPFVLNDYHLAIAPGNSAGKIDAMSGVGAGAYAIENYEQGVRAKLKKHANYWRSDYGHFDEVEVLTIADVAARTNALTTDEVDAIETANRSTAGGHRLQCDRGLAEADATDLVQFFLVEDHQLAGQPRHDIGLGHEDRFLGTGLLAQPAVDATQHVDLELVRLFLDLRAPGVVGRDLAGLDRDGQRRTDPLAHVAGHALGPAVLILDQCRNTAIAITELALLFRVLDRVLLEKHVAQGDTHPGKDARKV